MKQLNCVFDSYLYQSDDGSGYAIFRTWARKEGCPKTMFIIKSKGCAIPDTLTYGTPLRLIGEATKDSKYNEKCFMCYAIEVVMPADNYDTIQYLSGLGINGLTESVAEYWVELWGKDIKSVLDTHTNKEAIGAFNAHVKLKIETFKKEEEEREEKLRKLSAFSVTSPLKPKTPKKSVLKASVLDSLRIRIDAANAEHTVYVELRNDGFSYTQVHKMFSIVEKEMNDTPTVETFYDWLKEKNKSVNGELKYGCYRVCREAEVPFPLADILGKKLGFLPYTRERVSELCRWVLGNAESSGDTWISVKDMYNKANRVQSQTAFPEVRIAKNALLSAMKTLPKVFRLEEGEKIYSQSLYYDEKDVAYHSKRIAAVQSKCNYNENTIAEVEQERGIQFSQNQKRCFEFLKTSGLKIITGGAGTGKTTVISGLLDVYTRLNPNADVALCAPTGRAAQRMTELCERYGAEVKASTIHKLLEITPQADGKDDTPFNPSSPLGAELIIVDELSMVGVHLCSLLLRAIKNGALVIFCGDYNQLPSVEAGKVFRDMIESGKFETVRLDVNYRQKSESGRGLIISNATKIMEGDKSLVTGADFNIKYCDSVDAMKEEVIDLIKKDPDQTILTTIKGSEVGTMALNAVLQPIKNPNPVSKIEYGKQIFCTGDAVLMTGNNYKDGYVNGDIGKIISIDEEGCEVEFGNDRKYLSRKCMKDMQLAYAMTIHKSQGSEYDKVIIVLPDEAKNMLQRTLFYTAVTRARKNVTIITQPGNVDLAIDCDTSVQRRSSLKAALGAETKEEK